MGEKTQAKRTAGRLRMDEYGGVLADGGCKLVLTGVALSTGCGGPEDPAPANTRFVFAAWNAAHDADLSTEALEAGVVKQALAALEKTERIASRGDVNVQPLLDPILAAVRPALAAARGGP